MSWFFFQAEDGIRDLVRSRGLGDVYKRQVLARPEGLGMAHAMKANRQVWTWLAYALVAVLGLSLIHI